MIDEDVEFVPLQPEEIGGADLELFKSLEEGIREPLETVEQNGVYAESPVAEEDDVVIEFIPEAPRLEAPDGELTPIIDNPSAEIRKEIEKEINTPHLTEREKQMLYAVRSMQHENRYAPTCHELARLFGYSSARAKKLVKALVMKGLLEWSKHHNWVHKRLLFPKNIRFPWRDERQFPKTVFVPEDLEHREIYWEKKGR